MIIVDIGNSCYTLVSWARGGIPIYEQGFGQGFIKTIFIKNN